MQNLFNHIDYRVARSRDELEQAYALVYKEYLKRGYVDEGGVQMRLSLYNILPETTTFVATSEHSVMATATVIPDSPLGLPIDELYSEELNLFRKHGRKMCEVSMLASDTSLFREGASVMLNAKKMFFVFFLFKHIFEYVRNYLHLDYIFITINPKHRLTYEYLQFTDVGPIQYYDKVNGAPGLGKCLKVQSAEENLQKSKQKGLYKMFFAGKIDSAKFSQKMCLSIKDIKYFFSENTNLLLKASSDELKYIKECYPSYNFSEIIPSNVFKY